MADDAIRGIKEDGVQTLPSSYQTSSISRVTEGDTPDQLQAPG